MPFLDGSHPDHFEAQPKAHRLSQRALRESNADVGYAMAAGRAFEALKHALGLMTGVLLLDLVGSERGVVDAPLGDKAREALAEARAEIARLNPPGVTAAHHAYHLRRALAHIDEAATWGAKQADLIAGQHTDAYCDAIRAAWAELSKLDRLMSGFSMIDVSQSCCAFHAELAAKIAASA